MYTIGANGQLCVWEADTELDGLIPWPEGEEKEEEKEEEEKEGDKEESEVKKEPAEESESGAKKG